MGSFIYLSFIFFLLVNQRLCIRTKKKPLADVRLAKTLEQPEIELFH